MKFTLEINCENAAFYAENTTMQDSVSLEVQRILSSAARRIRIDGLNTSNTALFDGNGNRVGSFQYGAVKQPGSK